MMSDAEFLARRRAAGQRSGPLPRRKGARSNRLVPRARGPICPLPHPRATRSCWAAARDRKWQLGAASVRPEPLGGPIATWRSSRAGGRARDVAGAVASPTSFRTASFYDESVAPGARSGCCCPAGSVRAAGFFTRTIGRSRRAFGRSPLADGWASSGAKSESDATPLPPLSELAVLLALPPPAQSRLGC